MTVPDVGGAKTTYRPTQHVLNGLQLIDRFINKNFIHAILQGTLCYKFYPTRPRFRQGKPIFPHSGCARMLIYRRRRGKLAMS
jgi:hypothetical protein